MSGSFNFLDSGVVVKQISDDQLQQAFDVRLEVFVGEQNVPLAEEIDDLDVAPSTVHVLAFDSSSGEVLGTARLLPTPGVPGHFHIGRVAVLAKARGRNVGAALMQALESVAVNTVSESQNVVVALSAQIQAAGFYRKLGYVQVSDNEYLDAGILHVDMEKTVSL